MRLRVEWRFLALMVVGRIPGSMVTALLASEWVTGSVSAWISVGALVAVVLALGFAYRGRLETWMFRRTELASTLPETRRGEGPR